MTNYLKFFLKVFFTLIGLVSLSTALNAKTAIQLNPFFGVQFFGQASVYQEKEKYNLQTTDFTMGLRASLILENFNIGFEYFGGYEKSVRLDLADEWSKAAFGVFGTFHYKLWSLRTTIYLSADKTLKSDTDAGPGNLDESASGQGAGIGIDYQILSNLLITYDYRHLSFEKIGDQELIGSNYSELENTEYAFGLSYLFNFETSLFGEDKKE